MTNQIPELKKAEELKVEAEKKALAKKEEEKKKEEKKKLLPKPKYYYDVKVECMLPAILTYRVLAETPQQAAEIIKGRSPNTVQHKLIGKKELALRVYDAGSSMIKLILNSWKK